MATVPITPEEAAKAMLSWDNNWTTSLIKFIVLTLVCLCVLVVMLQFGNLQEIAKNFSRYRCNPLIMPFASNFGYDATENFNFCLSNLFQLKAVEVFTPLYELLNVFTSIVSQIVNVVLGIRKLFSNFLYGVNRFVRSVRDRIQQLMMSVRMSFLRLNNLMGRVYGTMYAVMWMGLSALTAGFNVADNNLVKFLFEFCFDPNTPIRLANNSVVPLSAVRVGDVLAPVAGNDRPVVTSVFMFDGTQTPMVNVHGVFMSSEHYVQYGGLWMAAKDHPDAVATTSLPYLACLNVSGHMFSIGDAGIIVADYDEHSSLQVVKDTQRLALRAVNGGIYNAATSDDYSLGFDGMMLIKMKDTSWKHARDVRIGDVLFSAGVILGIVQEDCKSVVVVDGLKIAAAQLVFDPDAKMWTRCLMRYKALATSAVLYSFVTDNCSTIIAHTSKHELFLRDYREVALPEMEDAYKKEFVTQN
jgi:hypothetical protein